ncbi:MAG: hypothetical protein ACRD0E_08525, partial [Acidimicrobiales bacterium]
MMGHADPHRRRILARAGEALPRRLDSKTVFMRVMVETSDDGRCTVRSAGGQGSNILGVMARAQGLAVLTPGSGVGVGDEVEVMLLGP